jgi:hypothetical protein
MRPQGRVLCAVAAAAGLAAISYYCFRGRAAIEAIAATSPQVEQRAPAVAASDPTVAPAPPEAPPYIPYDQIPTVAAAENRVIHTTSAMGEPMEVYPDGTVIIHDHREVFTYADGRQEVRYARITAKPVSVPRAGVVIPPGDTPSK